MITDILIGFFALVAAVFLWLAHAGDNPDAQALAGIFYIPAIFFGALAGIAVFIKMVF